MEGYLGWEGEGVVFSFPGCTHLRVYSPLFPENLPWARHCAKYWKVAGVVVALGYCELGIPAQEPWVSCHSVGTPVLSCSYLY